MEMLRWNLTTSGLTAFNQSLADQYLGGLLLIVPARGRVNIKSIKLLVNELFLLDYLFLISTFPNTSSGGGSDFLSSLACFEQVSFLSKNFCFSFNARFWFSSVKYFVSSEYAITLLLLNWERGFDCFWVL